MELRASQNNIQGYQKEIKKTQKPQRLSVRQEAGNLAFPGIPHSGLAKIQNDNINTVLVIIEGQIGHSGTTERQVGPREIERVPIVGGDTLKVVAHVLGVLEDKALLRGHGVAADAADELGGLATEHGAQDQLNITRFAARHWREVDSNEENEQREARGIPGLGEGCKNSPRNQDEEAIGAIFGFESLALERAREAPISADSAVSSLLFGVNSWPKNEAGALILPRSNRPNNLKTILLYI